jgi:signal transduction histidine kinase
MSHELRTPLNAILGYAELAEEGIDDGAHDEARADLGRVRSAGTHLLRLVGDILDLTAIESGQVPFDPSPVELLSVAEEVTDDVRGAAAHKSLDVDCSGTPVTVVHDPARVRQVLAAILSNAVKFTDTGGVRVRAEPGDHGAVLRIEDTGPGMDDETLARAGEIFEQGDGSSTRAHEGTGLGLPVALGLARSMGWRVDMESTPGEGSIFTMFIPSVHPGHGASTDLA